MSLATVLKTWYNSTRLMSSVMWNATKQGVKIANFPLFATAYTLNYIMYVLLAVFVFHMSIKYIVKLKPAEVETQVGSQLHEVLKEEQKSKSLGSKTLDALTSTLSSALVIILNQIAKLSLSLNKALKKRQLYSDVQNIFEAQNIGLKGKLWNMVSNYAGPQLIMSMVQNVLMGLLDFISQIGSQKDQKKYQEDVEDMKATLKMLRDINDSKNKIQFPLSQVMKLYGDNLTNDDREVARLFIQKLATSTEKDFEKLTSFQLDDRKLIIDFVIKKLESFLSSNFKINEGFVTKVNNLLNENNEKRYSIENILNLVKLESMEGYEKFIKQLEVRMNQNFLNYKTDDKKFNQNDIHNFLEEKTNKLDMSLGVIEEPLIAFFVNLKIYDVQDLQTLFTFLKTINVNKTNEFLAALRCITLLYNQHIPIEKSVALLKSLQVNYVDFEQIILNVIKLKNPPEESGFFDRIKFKRSKDKQVHIVNEKVFYDLATFDLNQMKLCTMLLNYVNLDVQEAINFTKALKKQQVLNLTEQIKNLKFNSQSKTYKIWRKYDNFTQRREKLIQVKQTILDIIVSVLGNLTDININVNLDTILKAAKIEQYNELLKNMCVDVRDHFNSDGKEIYRQKLVLLQFISDLRDIIYEFNVIFTILIRAFYAKNMRELQKDTIQPRLAILKELIQKTEACEKDDFSTCVQFIRDCDDTKNNPNNIPLTESEQIVKKSGDVYTVPVLYGIFLNINSIEDVNIKRNVETNVEQILLKYPPKNNDEEEIENLQEFNYNTILWSFQSPTTALELKKLLEHEYRLFKSTEPDDTKVYKTIDLSLVAQKVAETPVLKKDDEKEDILKKLNEEISALQTVRIDQILLSGKSSLAAAPTLAVKNTKDKHVEKVDAINRLIVAIDQHRNDLEQEFEIIRNMTHEQLFGENQSQNGIKYLFMCRQFDLRFKLYANLKQMLNIIRDFYTYERNPTLKTLKLDYSRGDFEYKFKMLKITLYQIKGCYEENFIAAFSDLREVLKEGAVLKLEERVKGKLAMETLEAVQAGKIDIKYMSF